MNAVSQTVDFNIVRYANCWEDADVLVAALASNGSPERILSIASAGDNVLALLAEAPALVVAFDLSAPQLACLELRIVAFRCLAYEEVLSFLGASEASNRIATYLSFRRLLSTGARSYWDSRLDAIETGVIHAGRFEDYFRRFRRLLRLVHGSDTVRSLLAQKPESARREFFDSEWNSWRWRFMAHAFFSRRVMAALGRDPRFFDQVEGSVARRVLAKAQRAVTELDTANNPYLNYVLTGQFGAGLPKYLRREHFDTIRMHLDVVQPVQAELGDISARRFGKFDAFNLSDIFEYMSPRTFETCARSISAISANEATLAYWNMLVPRSLAEAMPGSFKRDENSSSLLHRQDKAFFYDAFCVDRFYEEKADVSGIR